MEEDELMVNQILEDLGHVSILVNNAGIASHGRMVADTDAAELQRVVATHAFAQHSVSYTHLTLPTSDLV